MNVWSSEVRRSWSGLELWASLVQQVWLWWLFINNWTQQSTLVSFCCRFISWIWGLMGWSLTTRTSFTLTVLDRWEFSVLLPGRPEDVLKTSWRRPKRPEGVLLREMRKGLRNAALWGVTPLSLQRSLLGRPGRWNPGSPSENAQWPKSQPHNGRLHNERQK